ncbi:hypothetical protein NC981_08860 [Leptolyngbya sp. DQ-M1]|uniref:glycosyltransferase family 8 protein n=1 Tax=Leptolyngbya sp. DQ-M1 TaxID=2933920 RepID=UPI00329A264E
MQINIAIASDRNMEVGLHVTLYTALQFLDPDAFVNIHLFSKDFSSQAIERIHQTLSPYRDRYHLQTYDVATLDLGSGKGLHYNKMPYVILLAANLVEAEKLLFLDADLIIRTDLSKLFAYPLEDKIIGAVFESYVSNTWNKEYGLLKQIGLPDDAPYFNSGVVLFDAKRWKQEQMSLRCFKIIDEYGKLLHNTDQTVLNAAVGGEFLLLPHKYNRPFYPGGYGITDDSDCICHLVGSPKPWDLFGEVLHNSYPAFYRYLKETALQNYKSYLTPSIPRLQRTFALSRSYYSLVKWQVKQRFFTNSALDKRAN